MARGDNFSYTVNPDFDYTIDEKGNTFIALRQIDWGNKGEYKLDLRKYYASEEGETMSKGLSFLTEDGPDELTRVLIETGYGDDEQIANTLIENRPYVLAHIKAEFDSNPELVKSLGDSRFFKKDEEYYDPEELMA
jgi:hypothetical protein